MYCKKISKILLFVLLIVLSTCVSVFAEITTTLAPDSENNYSDKNNCVAYTKRKIKEMYGIKITGNLTTYENKKELCNVGLDETPKPGWAVIMPSPSSCFASYGHMAFIENVWYDEDYDGLMISLYDANWTYKGRNEVVCQRIGPLDEMIEKCGFDGYYDPKR